MLKFAVCDDNSSLRSKFVSMLQKVLEKNNIEGQVVFDTGDPEYFFEYISKNHVDVVLLDIDLRSMMSGLDLAKKIREVNKSVSIIFITAHIEYVLMAFKVKTFDYLVKPISQNKLEECILRLSQFTCSDSVNFVKVKSGPSTHLIKKNDIIYIEKVNSKSFIYTTNEIIETYSTLDELERILPGNFIRSHKSYIINIGKVTKIDAITNEVIFNNSFKCYVGRKYKKMLMDYLSKNNL